MKGLVYSFKLDGQDEQRLEEDGLLTTWIFWEKTVPEEGAVNAKALRQKLLYVGRKSK